MRFKALQWLFRKQTNIFFTLRFGFYLEILRTSMQNHQNSYDFQAHQAQPVCRSAGLACKLPATHSQLKALSERLRVVEPKQLRHICQ